MADKKPIKITETVLRDAHQSLIATRMTTEQMLPIIDKMDKVGYHSVECWGGATFDASLRFLKEDPWERLRKLRDGFKNTKLQMLFRGQNILGYRHYADDVSMLAVTFALAGCSSSDKKVEFDYDGNTLVQIAETQATNYMQIAQVEDVYNFYVDEEANGGQVDETTADALKVFSTIESDYGKFQQFKPVNLEDEDDKTIQEVDDKVVVTLYAECAEKEAIVKATFVDNSVTYNFQKYSVMAQNQYSEEEADQMLASNGVYPYKISEFEVAANQTLKDKMKDAGANTLIGMGIVFIALIFISFIISLLKYVPALLDKETREKRKAEKAKKALGSVATLNVDKEDETPAGSAPAPAGIVDIVNTATGESVMNDSELVAVISAAVMAAQGGKTRVRVNYPSNDKLVVRPRKKNKR